MPQNNKLFKTSLNLMGKTQLKISILKNSSRISNKLLKMHVRASFRLIHHTLLISICHSHSNHAWSIWTFKQIIINSTNSNLWVELISLHNKLLLLRIMQHPSLVSLEQILQFPRCLDREQSLSSKLAMNFICRAIILASTLTIISNKIQRNREMCNRYKVSLIWRTWKWKN